MDILTTRTIAALTALRRVRLQSEAGELVEDDLLERLHSNLDEVLVDIIDTAGPDAQAEMERQLASVANKYPREGDPAAVRYSGLEAEMERVLDAMDEAESHGEHDTFKALAKRRDEIEDALSEMGDVQMLSAV